MNRKISIKQKIKFILQFILLSFLFAILIRAFTGVSFTTPINVVIGCGIIAIYFLGRYHGRFINIKKKIRKRKKR